MLFWYIQITGMSLPPAVKTKTSSAILDLLTVEKQADSTFFSRIPRDVIPRIVQYLSTETSDSNLDSTERSLVFFVNSYPDEVRIASKNKLTLNMLNKTLCSACSTGNVNLAKLLLRAGADKDATLPDGTTPFMHAMANGQLETTKLLHRIKADLFKKNTLGQSALLLAAKYGHLNTVQYFIKYTGDYSRTSTDKNGYNAFILAVLNGHLPVVEYLKFSFDPKKAVFGKYLYLREATLHNKISIVQKLTSDMTCNPNMRDNYGWFSLHWASFFGYLEITTYLLNAGASVNRKTEEGHSLSPLHCASMNNHFQVVHTLLNSRANVNALTETAETPLHKAAQKGHLDTVRVLLEFKAEINKKDSSGKTAIYIAAEQGHVHIVTELLSAKADKNIADNCGKTPIQIAQERENRAIVQMLMDD